MSETSFEKKCEILSELWIDYRNDEEFKDFIEYSDIGLPLAYMLDAGIVAEATELAKDFVDETFALLLSCLDIEEDTGFEYLEDILEIE